MSEFVTLHGLVSQYSPSGQESGAAAWLVAHMAALGFGQAFIDAAGNAIGIMGDGARQFVLLGHIDTVPGELPVEVVSDDSGAQVLTGRGSVDAKGPLACFVDAVAQTGAIVGWQLVIIGAVEEERDSKGARFVADQYRPDFLIVGEPNQWERIGLGYKGSAWAEITLERNQAHTASNAETAAEAAVAHWLRIRQFGEEYNTGKAKLFDQLLLNLQRISTESDDFRQSATLRIGARLPLAMAPESWYATLTQLAGMDVVTPVGYAIPAWACEKNTALIRAMLSAIRAQGGEPRFVYKTGTADLNIIAPVWQCPAVVYGPGDSSLDHTPEERISLTDYRQAVQVLVGAISKLTSG